MAVTAPVMASLVYAPHPFLPQEGRVLHFDPPTGEESLHAYITRVGVDLSVPVQVSVNHDVIPTEWLKWVKPKPDTVITVRAAVEGGDGSQVVAMVAMIALTVAAPYMAGAMYGLATSGMALTTAQASIWAANTAIGMAMTGAITVMGSMAISALTPKPKMDLGRGMSSAKDSPTYSLSGGSNQARPYEAISLTLGTHKAFFDLASNPYTVFRDGDQYLYQVFHVGLCGPYGAPRVTDLKIGDNPLSSYTDVQVEFSVDSMPTLMPFNVDTTGGAEITSATGAVVRTTSVDTTRIEVDMQFILFYSGNGGLENRSVSVDLEYRPVGSTTWLPMGWEGSTQDYTHYWSYGKWAYVGGSFFDDSSYVWKQSNYDSARSQEAHTDVGNYQQAGQQAGWRFIAYADKAASDAAPPQSNKNLVSRVTITGASSSPDRRTYGIDVPIGQYEVRVTRATADETDSRATADVNWAALKSYQSQQGSFLGQAFMAISVKASGQLSGSLSSVSGVISTPTSANTYSSNPADQYLLFARGFKVNGRLVWGAGLADSEIDLDGIAVWRAWCETKGLTFNAHLDSSRSVWDMLQAITKCGRGSPTWGPGKLSVVWDAGYQPVVAVFGPSNIKKGSFEVAYQSSQVTDEIVLTFVNKDKDYATEQIRELVPGVTTPLLTASTELWGCTDPAVATRECRLLAAHQVYRSRLVSWTADMEGLVVTRGDVVMMSHDLTQWGESGRLVAGTASVLTLERPVTVRAGGSWVNVIDPTGEQHTSRVMYVNDEPTDTITLLDPLPVAPSGDHAVDWRFVYDYLPTPGKRLKVVDVKPASMNEIKLTAMDDPSEYYDYEEGAYVAPPVRKWTSSDPKISNLQVSEEVIRVGNSNTLTMVVGWTETGSVSARTVSYSVSGAAWQDVTQVAGSFVRLNIPDSGTVQVRVELYNGMGVVTDESRASTTHVIEGIGAPRSGVINLGLVEPFVGTTCSIKWDQHIDAVSYKVEVWSAGVKRRTVTGITASNYSYTLDNNRADGGPFRTLEFRVFVVSGSGTLSAAATVSASNTQVAAPTGIEVVGAGKSLSISTARCMAPDYAATRFWVSQTPGFNYESTTPAYDGTDNSFSKLNLTPGTYYLRVAHYDQFGDANLNTSGELAVTVQGVGGMPSTTTLPANPAAIGGELALFLDSSNAALRGIWGWDGSAWKNTRDGANLVVNSVAADRLAVSSLSAISANLGSMTSGSITLDAAGFLRGGSTGYMTGTGVWMGYHSGAYKMHVGNPTGSGFTWDGTNFTIRGASGQVLLSSGSGVPVASVTGLQGAGVNRLYNSSRPASSGNDDGWTVWTNNPGGWGGDWTSDYSWYGTAAADLSLPGRASRFTVVAAAPAGRVADWSSGGQWMPVAPGMRLEASVLLGTHRCYGSLIVLLYNAAGQEHSTVVVGTSQESDGLPGGPLLSSWKKVGGFVTVPATTGGSTPSKPASAVLIIRQEHNPAYNDSYLFHDQAFLGEASPGQTVLSSWSDGTKTVTNTNQLTDGAGFAAAAAAAQQAANTANGLLADLASDGKLTPGEKQDALREWSAVANTYGGIDGQAAAYNITTERSNHTYTYNALGNYLSPLLANTGTTSDIDQTTWRNTWAAYYAYKQYLLNKIADVAKNAGATFGVNVSGKIPAGGAGVFMEDAAINAAQIGSLALVGTNNFSVRTGFSGARMEMDNRVIKVFDANGVMRVKLGDLSA